MRFLLLSILILGYSSSIGQVMSVQDLDTKYLNWHNKDFESSNVVGTSVDKAYSLITKNDSISGSEIIVAIIDSGVDIDHEDLQGRIWVNENEIPNNGIDDDANGYIDDIHGWNFIGNKDGENVHYENMEYTRIVRKNDLGDPSLALAKQLYNLEIQKRQKEKMNIQIFKRKYESWKAIVKANTGITVSKAEDLKLVDAKDSQTANAKRLLQERYEMGFTEQILENLIFTNSEYLDYFLNTSFNGRELIGDNPDDLEDKFYGNPDVKGPRSDHGTSVAGVVAAIRDNNIGINGIATKVKIMALRSTPRGDENDKDVALSIFYAVDNGAKIINMSFGKQFSPKKEFVDKAVKYAEEKGVLIIHGSGNSAKNIDEEDNFPSNTYLDGSKASNWMNIGASTLNLDTDIAAKFSNYGNENVHVFAPGVNIISTDSSSTYSMHDGTSLSAPVATGIAALVLSQYPDLTPAQLIDILLASSYKVTSPKKVYVPSLSDGKEKAKFEELSISGGIINAYDALLEAEKRNQY